jgi:hypothetical protein
MIASLALAACTFNGVTGEVGDVVDGAPAGDPDAGADGVADAAGVLIARVNVGGPAHSGVDFPGEWSADGGECDGTAQTIAGEVQNTVDDPLFNSWRFERPNTCALAVANGDYRVTLLFAEIFRGGCSSSTTTRIFTVNIEDTDVLTFDLMDGDNGRGCVLNPATPMARPVAKTFAVAVADGQLDVTMGFSGEDNGVLSGLEVLQLF